MSDYSALTVDAVAREILVQLQNSVKAIRIMATEGYSAELPYGKGTTLNVTYIPPGTPRRKASASAMTLDTQTATTIPIVMDQVWYDTLDFTDADQEKSIFDIGNTYLLPKVAPLASTIDRAVAGLAYEYWAQAVGQVGTEFSFDELVDANTTLDLTNTPEFSRNACLNAVHSGALIKEARLGRLETAVLYPNKFMGGLPTGLAVGQSNAMPIVSRTGQVYVTGAINLSAGYVAGSTVLVVDGFTSTVTTNSMCLIDGRIYKITAHTENTYTTGITITPGLHKAVANDAVIYVLTPGTADTTYAAGYDQAVKINTAVLQVGQGLYIGSEIYTVVSIPTAGSYMLNKPLAAQWTSGATCFPFPWGNYSWAGYSGVNVFCMRPPRDPDAGNNVAVSTLDYEGLAVRVMKSFVHLETKTIWTYDTLAGIKNVDYNKTYGALLIS